MKKSAQTFPPSWIRIALLAGMTLVTISLHYRGMSQSDQVLRGLFRQFCYLPILVAALWFGLRGGLITASVIVLAVAPNILFRDMAAPLIYQESLEYLYYFIFGGVFGYLADRERYAQRRREELVRQVARMEHLSTIGELAAGLAHEIKNPMGSIKGAAEILEPEIPPDHAKHEFIAILIEEVNRLNLVVEDFLRYARPLELSRSRFELRPVLEQVVREAGLARGDGVSIELEVGDSLAVFGDQERLKQVFLNLVLNAFDAMEGSGRLRIAAEAEREEAGVVISFADTGPGVPEDRRAKIFLPFQTSKESGTGLGLTISERIVIAHGGRIEIADALGGGAVFRVFLPGEE